MPDTAVTGTPRLLLRLEGAALLLAAMAGYQVLGASWATFALLFLVPDLSFAGYLGGPRLGAITYNALHSTIGVAGLATLAYFGDVATLWPIVLIWLAHVGFDRALGYGLKYGSAFQATHLGRIGRPSHVVVE